MSSVGLFVGRIVRFGKHILAPSPEIAGRRRLRRAAERAGRRVPGRIRVLDYDLEYADLLSICPQWQEIFVEGRLRFLARDARPRIFDCGANVGLASLYFKRIYPGARITAFEADPRLAAIARRNLDRNRAGDVELVPSAVWTSNTTLSFASEGTDSGAISHVAAPAPDATTIDVPAVRLRDRIAAERRVDMLKLDVEGAELPILRDVADVLPNVAQIAAEIHEFDSARRITSDVLDLLARAGFTCALDNFAALPWRTPAAPADAPFPGQALCWVVTVKAWRP